MDSGDYEYPGSLDNTPMPLSLANPDQSEQRNDSKNNLPEPSTEPPLYSNLQVNGNNTSVLPVDDSDSDYVEHEHISIKETSRGNSASIGNELENSNTIHIEGRLQSYHSSIKLRARSASSITELTGSLSEQGIYQGLSMTDTVKQSLGIMPESVYMATNLLENLGGEIELVNVVDEQGEEGERRGKIERNREGESPAPEEEEEEMGRPRLPSSRTDPNVFKPKIRRPMRACKH